MKNIKITKSDVPEYLVKSHFNSDYVLELNDDEEIEIRENVIALSIDTGYMQQYEFAPVKAFRNIGKKLRGK